MKVAVVKERRAFEHRVAASPDTVKRMVGMGLRTLPEHRGERLPGGFRLELLIEEQGCSKSGVGAGNPGVRIGNAPREE